jgi:hypothetical protein
MFGNMVGGLTWAIYSQTIFTYFATNVSRPMFKLTIKEKNSNAL